MHSEEAQSRLLYECGLASYSGQLIERENGLDRVVLCYKVPGNNLLQLWNVIKLSRLELTRHEAQSGFGSVADGSSPGKRNLSRCRSTTGSGIGTAEISACVYG